MTTIGKNIIVGTLICAIGGVLGIMGMPFFRQLWISIVGMIIFILGMALNVYQIVKLERRNGGESHGKR